MEHVEVSNMCRDAKQHVNLARKSRSCATRGWGGSSGSANRSHTRARVYVRASTMRLFNKLQGRLEHSSSHSGNLRYRSALQSWCVTFSEGFQGLFLFARLKHAKSVAERCF